MRTRVTQTHAAVAVVEQALAKVLVQLALAQSAAGICGNELTAELEHLIEKAGELRARVGNAMHLGGVHGSDSASSSSSGA